MRHTGWLLLGISALYTFTGIGCGSSGGDDDPVETPTPGDTPTPTPGPITLSGTVSIINSTTGEAFTESEWKSCYGPIIIYLLNDPADLQRPADKFVIESPGDFSFVTDPNSGSYYVTAIADTNRNYYISSQDTLMEYVYNPVGAGIMDVDNLDIEIETSSCGGCCGGGGTDTTYSTYEGRVLVDPTVPSNAIYMTLSDETFKGPYSASLLYEPGTFTLYGREDRLSKASILGILDLDDNGLFEPSDMIGVPEGNPYDVGDLGDELSFEDIDLVIGPDTVILDQPLVPVYVPVTGTVVYDGDQKSPIFVNLSSSQPRGPLVSGTRLDDGSRSFLLRGPQNTGNLWLWGVVDENGDGVGDPATEAWGKLGPLRTAETGLYNLELTLVPPGEPTPTNIPTETPTETAAPTPTPAPVTPTTAPTATPTTPDSGTDPTATPLPTPTQGSDTTPGDGTPNPGEDTPVDMTPTPTNGEVTPATPIPTPTAVPEPIMAELKGQVLYEGELEPGDVLRVGAQVREPEEGAPDYVGVFIEMDGQSFPMAYHITGLPPGSFGLYAYLDHGGNNPDGPGDEDIEGWYTVSGEIGAPATFQLESGEVKENMDLSLFY